MTDFSMSNSTAIPSQTIAFFTMSVLFLIGSAYMFWRTRKLIINTARSLREPLMEASQQPIKHDGVMI